MDNYIILNVYDFVNKTICWNFNETLLISPFLPSGLKFVNGNLLGAASEELSFREYSIYGMDNSRKLASFWLSGLFLFFH